MFLLTGEAAEVRSCLLFADYRAQPCLVEGSRFPRVSVVEGRRGWRGHVVVCGSMYLLVTVPQWVDDESSVSLGPFSFEDFFAYGYAFGPLLYAAVWHESFVSYKWCSVNAVCRQRFLIQNLSDFSRRVPALSNRREIRESR